MRISDWSSDVCSSDLPQTFQPTIDVDYSAVKIEMPPGTPLDDTAAVASRAAGLLAEQPEVMTVFQDIGSDGADVRMAMLYLRLKPGADRERTSVEFERAMAPRLQAKIGSAPGRARVCQYG